MLAGMRGFRYQAIIGEGKSLGISGGFSVNIQKLDATIAASI
jgi:hypothetical protein